MSIDLTSQESLQDLLSGQEISGSTFGVEYLGWGRLDFEWLKGEELPESVSSAGAAPEDSLHLRWPGGIPAEEPFSGNTAGGRQSDYDLKDLTLEDYVAGGVKDVTVPVFDLADPNYVNWYYHQHDIEPGSYGPEHERPGLSEIVEAAEGMGAESLAIVIPTARYAARMFEASEAGTLKSTDEISDVVQQIAEDMSFFLNNVTTEMEEQGASFDLTLEIGSEYYATRLWNYLLKQEQEFDIPVEEVQANLLETFGLVFAAQTAVISDFEEATGVEINTAIQLGRTQGGTNGFHGSAEDNQIFLQAFESLSSYWDKAAEVVPDYADTAIGYQALSDLVSGVDAAIWHRYTSEWETLDDHLTEDQSTATDGASHRASVEEMIGYWEDAGAGGEDGEVDLIAGWGAPVVPQSDNTDVRIYPAMMLEMFSNLTEAGVDMASIYAWNSNKIGALSHAGQKLIGGQIFEMMADALPGTYLNSVSADNTKLFQDSSDSAADADGDGWIDPAAPPGTVNEYHFSNSYKVVSYFAAGDVGETSPLEFSATFGGPSLTSVEATSLFLDTETASDSAVYEVLPNGQVTDKLLGYTGTIADKTIEVTQQGGGQTDIAFDFEHDYEVVQVTGYFDTAYVLESFDLANIEAAAQDAVFNIDAGSVAVAEPIVLAGSDSDNIISGHAGEDLIFGRDGADALYGGAGDDFLNPGGGLDGGLEAADSLYGGEGSDTFFIDATDGNVNAVVFDNGGTGQDTLQVAGIDINELSIDLVESEEAQFLQLAWEDDQVLLAEAGSAVESIIIGENVFDGNVLVGSDAEPRTGDQGANLLFGNGGATTLKAANGDDLIVSAAAASNISGGGGSDIVLTGYGDDAIWTHGGDDMIVLQGGQNTVFAGAGNDIIFLEGGQSIVSGDLGSDLFVVRNESGDSDKIVGFESGSDAIDLTHYAGLNYEDLVFGQSEQSGNLTVSFGYQGGDYVLEISFVDDAHVSEEPEELIILSGEEVASDRPALAIDPRVCDGLTSFQDIEEDARAEPDLEYMYSLI
jgi:Ca2+-binding RTX toxin-like protein